MNTRNVVVFAILLVLSLTVMYMVFSIATSPRP